VAYPDLQFVRRAADIVLVGDYPISESGRVIDRYRVEVRLPRESEFGLPTVVEIGNRIPRVADRHMEPDGKACVFLPDAFWYDNPGGMSLMDFLAGPLRAYFANQTLIELGGKGAWGDGEWSHGADGIVEFYKSSLGTEDRTVIARYLDMLSREVIKGHWPCPCGSGAALRHCHIATIRGLQKQIPPSVAAASAVRLGRALIDR